MVPISQLTGFGEHASTLS